MDLAYCERGLAFCADHDTERQIGVLEEVTVDTDGCIRGLLRFGAHPDAAWIEKDMRDGVRPYVSVGYRINAMLLTECDENDNCTYRVTSWTLLEGSSVAVPADVSVGVGRDADLDAFPLVIVRQANLTPRKGKEKEDSMGTSAAPAPAPAAAPTNPDAIRMAVEAERERASTIRSMASELGVADTDVQRFIDDGSDVGAAGRALIALKRTQGAGRPAAVVTTTHDRAGDRPWDNAGDFFRAVIDAGRGRGVDPRLSTRAASGVGEGIGSEGGFWVAPPAVMDTLLERITGPQGGEILRRVNQIPVTVGNGTKVPGIDESSRASGSRWGGVSVTYGDEGGTIATSKPKARQVELNLKKAVGACVITEEMLEDSPMATTIIEQAFGEEFTFVIEDMIMNGTGAGTPLGIMNSGSLVTQTKEAAQAANTFNAANAAKMYSRFGGKTARGAWLVDQSVLAQLMQMTVGQSPVFLPPGGLKDSPYGFLLGMPVIFTEYNAALSSLGDVVLADLGYYLFAVKGGLRQAQSMHVRFLQDEQVLKFVHRHDGQPSINAPLTPKNGGATRSPFVTLEAR